MFVDETGLGTFITYLKDNYGIVIGPIFMTNWRINDHTLDLITRTAKHKNIIIAGHSLSCNLSNQKTIVFRPQITKVQDLFDVQMRLTDVSDDLPIKVHFNMECSELNNYYTSSHPRLMNTNKYDKFYDITLPNIAEKTKEITAISLAMSIMIHNFEDFDINYKDFKSFNLNVMAQDMVHSKTSYTFPDVLSWFYGLSNSVISVLDAISDITFIVFLSYHTEERHNAAYFLLVLIVGNLISVAIMISLIAIRSIEIQSFLKGIFYISIFMVLSPILAATEWLFKRLKVENEDFLIVSPHHDGILLWLEQELIRNDIFLFECIFESCFQIIMQLIAVFVVDGMIYTDIYLYSSITLSLLVILSKFILLSYNLHRSQMFLNLLCYLMDIFFALVFGIFIGSFLLQNIKSFIALYMLFECLLFIPCYAHIILSSSLPLLSIPLLPILYYPLFIFSLSSFSMYPVFKHLMTNPMKIGQREELYQMLYQYCCNSQDADEFARKIIVINYVAIQSYFETLKQEDDADFYRFAHWLYQQPPYDLSDIGLNVLYDKSNNTILYKLFNFINKHSILKSLNTRYIVIVKSLQLLMRASIIPLCILLDITYLKKFGNNSRFMGTYKNIISLFGIIGLILFITWTCFVVYEWRKSKWNTFCFGMITPTHKNFVLSTSPSVFIDKCSEILNKTDREIRKSVILRDLINLKLSSINNDKVILNRMFEDNEPDARYLHQLIFTILMAVLILILTIVIESDHDSICIKNSHYTEIWILIMMICTILLSIIGIYLYFFNDNMINGLDVSVIMKSILFSFSLSGVIVYFYMFHFYSNIQCQYNSLWISVMFISFCIAVLDIMINFCIYPTKDHTVDTKTPTLKDLSTYIYQDGIYKIAVLGAAESGKSFLTVALVTDNYDHDPTIEGSYKKSVDIDGRSCLLDIVDTSGQEEFSALQMYWMREVHAFLVVYSITSRSTFDEAQRIRKQIVIAKDNEECVIVLVGNNCHLNNDRQVQFEEAEELANQWGIYSAFYEVSAEKKINNEECFYQAVRLLWKQWTEDNDNRKRKVDKSIRVQRF